MKRHGETRLDGVAPALPSPANPRGALASRDIARFFHHYITTLAPWYDLSDASMMFGVRLPRLALDSPLLFSAIIALSAMQITKTTSPGAKAVAEFYHGHCVSLLIALDSNADLAEREIALAAACLLRTYEIQDEETDPNRHLQGAFSLASSYIPGRHDAEYPLLPAGFWNYLREDITHGLFEDRPLKMDLCNIPLPTECPTDHTWLNAISLILGQILNGYMNETLHDAYWHRMRANLSKWRLALPAHCTPFSRANPLPGEVFPSIWMLRDCHAAARHYFLVALYLLGHAASASDLEELKVLEPTGARSREDFLEWCALDIVGIAFTCGSQAVLVNAFGPIAFCSRSLRLAAAQQELIRLLNPCAKTIGWPVQRMITDLQNRWQKGRQGAASTSSP
ncbi:hypothetical protein VTI74DRAFT_11522 [Chaetomium olivicolor]